jgi:hypothetical protein
MADLPQDEIERRVAIERYERRLVAFFDVLGWRQKIAEAAVDHTKLHEVHRVSRVFAAISKTPPSPHAVKLVQTSFSDHVVVSAPVAADFTPVLARLAILPLGTAQFGCYVRGAVMIGEILHDSEIVHGPALIRAYDLEQSVARVPRIILDSDKMTEFGPLAGFVKQEDGVYFLDPFSREFIGWLKTMQTEQQISAASQRGERLFQQMDADVVLGTCPKWTQTRLSM